eukprot:TRINITY_DN4175_c0_g2_i1.p1 TRINITY_DN4175_c0_g2~~TRINITY_DN4175_c0_g2_i1.p1  ORF type:complete len:418 (+),score=87.20 TRINITY_DN4175_c0_g2_i1:790-2043(+)
MREIVTIQIGGCGVRMGSRFWGEVIEERGITRDGEGLTSMENGRLFEEGKNGRLVPRSIMLDTDPATIDILEGCSLGSLFRPDYNIRGSGGTGNLYAVGRYECSDVRDQALDVLRRQVETCDRLEGFQLCHSLCGGTGSGVTHALLEDLRQCYSDKVVTTYTHTDATPREGWSTVQTYNMVLGTNPLVEYADMTVYLDGVLMRNQAVQQGTKCFAPAGKLINTVCSADTNMRKIATNLIPFPRMHFLTPSYSTPAPHDDSSCDTLVRKVITKRDFLFPCKFDSTYTTAVFLRGPGVTTCDVEQASGFMKNTINFRHTSWIPDKIYAASGKAATMSAALLVNEGSGVRDYSKALGDQFTAGFRRKAFLHWYTEKGMDEMEFTEAESNLNDLLTEYSWSCCWVHTEEEEGSFDEEEEED